MSTPFTWTGAIIAGLAGALAMLPIVYLAPLIKLPRIDMVEIIGSVFGLYHASARIFGLLLHLTLGVILAICYAAIWHGGFWTAAWWFGGILGFVQGLIFIPFYVARLHLPVRSLRVMLSPPAGISAGDLDTIAEPHLIGIPFSIMTVILGGCTFYGVIVALVYAGFTH